MEHHNSRFGRLEEIAVVGAALSCMFLAFAAFFRPPGASPPSKTRPDVRIEDSLWAVVATGGHRWGPDTARVVIVEFTDFQCPFCKRFSPILDDLRKEYPHDVAVVIRHWPLPSHDLAYPAARAAECAGNQGKFIEFHNGVFESAGRLTPELLHDVATKMGLDTKWFRSCAGDKEPVASIDSDAKLARAVGGRGTPTVLVNGIRLGSTPGRERLSELVAGELRNRRSPKSRVNILVLPSTDRR